MNECKLFDNNISACLSGAMLHDPATAKRYYMSRDMHNESFIINNNWKKMIDHYYTNIDSTCNETNNDNVGGEDSYKYAPSPNSPEWSPPFTPQWSPPRSPEWSPPIAPQWSPPPHITALPHIPPSSPYTPSPTYQSHWASPPYTSFSPPPSTYFTSPFSSTLSPSPSYYTPYTLPSRFPPTQWSTAPPSAHNHPHSSVTHHRYNSPRINKQPGIVEREGDWVCFNCNNFNFTHRLFCKCCGKSKYN